MSPVIRRTFVSTPARDAADTWHSIVELLSGGKDTPAKAELLSVAGVAASVIADQAPGTAPIIVTCDGPRTRIYCIYDDDAIDGSDAHEDSLGYDALKGEWAVSLPCEADDLTWVTNALKRHSERITARDKAVGISKIAEEESSTASLELDLKGLLQS